MAKYYQLYKVLILASAMSGVYFPSMDKIYEGRWSVKLLKVLPLFPGLVMPAYLLTSLKYQFFDEDELANKMYGYTILIFVVLVNFSFYGFNYYRNDLTRIFELWDSMFQEDLYPEDRQELLKRNRKITNGWLTNCGGLLIVSCFVYFSVKFFDSNKKLNHPFGIPHRPQSPDYELINLVEMILTCFGLAALLCFDTMTMTILSFEESQLRHLKRSLPKILDTISVSKDGKIFVHSEQIGGGRLDAWKMKTALEEVDGKFRIWLSHHRQIIKFHNEFEKVFRTTIAIKFTIFVLMLCFVAFTVLVGKLGLSEFLFSVIFCLVSYGIFYVNVTYADSILELGDSIFREAFEKSWYLYPKKFTDAFIVITLNSHRPVHYLAFKKYSLTSNNFLKVLTSAYSLLAFLIQANRRKINALEL